MKHEPFYIFFYSFGCPKCDTPRPWYITTTSGKPDETDYSLNCVYCNFEFTVKPSQHSYCHAVFYREGKYYPYHI
jgi:hypothetical protein